METVDAVKFAVDGVLSAGITALWFAYQKALSEANERAKAENDWKARLLERLAGMKEEGTK